MRGHFRRPVGGDRATTKLKTWDIYPLSKTPLALLLGERIDLSGKTVRDVKEEPDLITIKLGDKSMFGDSSITMMFDPKTLDLRQWTITDNAGQGHLGDDLQRQDRRQRRPADTFAIDYTANRELNTKTR